MTHKEKLLTLCSTMLLSGILFSIDAKSVKPVQKGDLVSEEDFKHKDENYWRKKLTPEQFNILREHGTERAFTGKYDHFKGKGIYKCAACGLTLFDSETKYDSGSGWPSFWAPIDPTHIETKTDTKFGMLRTEVLCPRCGGHLGHVFDDGPKPTGKRFCMNSAALEFEPK